MEPDSLVTRKDGKSEGWGLILLGSFVLFTWGDTGLAYGPPDVFFKRGLTHGLFERVSKTPVPEPADAVLIQSKEWKWNRCLKNAFHFPDWFDFGLERRTRLEMYDHPWRSSQASGQTDAQIQQRSRVRFGLNGRNLKFLWRDSMVHLDDLDSHGNANIKNEMDVLQLVVSVTVENALETGFRTDLHVGRFTMDFGGSAA